MQVSRIIKQADANSVQSGKRWFIIIGSLTSCIGTIIAGRASTIGQIIAGQCLSGMGVGGILTSIAATQDVSIGDPGHFMKRMTELVALDYA